MLERIGNAVVAEHMAPIDRRARWWLWSGWAVSALLGFLMPLYKGTVHLHGGVVIGAAVLVMIAVASATRRPMICLTMSAFGSIAGSALGFGLLAALTHRPITFAITAQMALGGAFLGRLFLRELRPREAPPEDPFWEEVKLLPKEEAQARVRARLETLHAEIGQMNESLERTNRGIKIAISGGVIALIGGGALVGAGHTVWRGKAVYAALPLVIVGLFLVLIGSWVTKKV